MRSLILFSIILSTVSASGHLRLDLTSSTDCAIQIVTNILHAESFSLTMGETRTTSFHSLHRDTTVKVTLSIDGGAPQEQVYQLKKTGSPKRDVLTFNDVAVLVEATFECNEGFIGSKCSKPRAPKPTTTTTKVTTSTTPISTTTTTVSAPVQSGSHFIPALVPVTIIAVIFILILFICLFLRKQKKNTYIEPEINCESPEIKKKDISWDSGFSTGSPRYTEEPSTIL